MINDEQTTDESQGEQQAANEQSISSRGDAGRMISEQIKRQARRAAGAGAGRAKVQSKAQSAKAQGAKR